MNKFCNLFVFILFEINEGFTQIEGVALISDNHLFLGKAEINLPGNYLNSYNLLSYSEPFFTKINSLIKSSKYEFPFCWDVYLDTLYCIASRQEKEIRMSVSFFQSKLSKLSRNEIFRSDSIRLAAMEKEYPKIEDRMNALGERLMKKEIESNFRQAFPVTGLFSEKVGIFIERNKKYLKDKDIITYDFITLNRDTHLFFVRDNRQLSIWKYVYPAIGEKSVDSDWQEMITYSSDSTYTPPLKSFYYKPNFAFHSSMGKTQFLAIEDSLFFKGHFKAILQDGETFLINYKSGAIYHFQKKKVVKIGVLDVENQKFTTKEGTIFIEDRDNRQLVFFGKVNKIGQPLKFPEYLEILTEEDLDKAFPVIKKIFIPINKN